MKYEAFEKLVGEKVFIRTVTYHSVGKVVSCEGGLLKLEDASWIACSGRFSNTIKDGDLEEVEPVGDMWINIDAIVDMFPWNHSLDLKQK